LMRLPPGEAFEMGTLGLHVPDACSSVDGRRMCVLGRALARDATLSSLVRHGCANRKVYERGLEPRL
jgi:hypothetical protein